MTLDLVLSFDHELSLGGVSSYGRNLFDPCERLLDLAGELEVPICLFTDILAFVRFQEWGVAAFVDPYRRQLWRTLREGHEVELHIHPHWLETELHDGGFRHGKRYSLGDFSDARPPQDVEGIIRVSVETLTHICREARPTYVCSAFRAGGFCYGQDEASTIRSLYRHGIRVDSSIGKGMTFRGAAGSFDYRCMPLAANWFIGIDGPLNCAAAGGLLEVPIASKPRTCLNSVRYLVNRLVYRSRAYDSGGKSLHEKRDGWVARIPRLFRPSAWLLGFDYNTHTTRDLMSILQYHIQSHRQDGYVACSAIGHPKCMGAYQRQLLRSFVQCVRDEYGSTVRFTTFAEVSAAKRDEHLRESGAKTIGV